MDMSIKLNNGNLAALPQSVRRPQYDRSKLTPGIVHIGLGNFHRAHQAWYLQQLMQQGLALDWAIIGAGVRSYDEAQRLKLQAQDYLTTLIELDPAGKSVEIVGSMIGYIPVEEGHGALIRQLSDPAIRIVSLTVTEGGYFLDPATKQFEVSHSEIAHDIAHLDRPKTAFGAIIAALRNRRDTGLGPFTCQSCDNLPGNGDKMREVILGMAKRIDASLYDWIEKHVTFPNSMVDCIVPATGPRELAMCQDFGIDDAVPVTHENFRQWVIEDQFCAGRPPWEKVGATISNRVHDFEAMKLRMLNGGHQIIVAPAETLGIETISATMAHPLIKAMFRKIELEEIAPHVPDVPDTTPATYCDLLDKRFSNPSIYDTVRRVAFDGSSRQTGFVLPIIRDALRVGTPFEGLALSQALWARFCSGVRENSTQIEPNDPIWSELVAVSNAARQNPKAWLEQRKLYGNLADDARFAKSFARWLNLIWDKGVENAMRTYIGA